MKSFVLMSKRTGHLFEGWLFRREPNGWFVESPEGFYLLGQATMEKEFENLGEL